VPDRPKDYGAYRRMRTLSDLPNGLTLDLLRQLGCVASDTGNVGGAVVQYGADRSLKGIEFIATRLSKPCETAVRYLSIISAIPAPREMSAEKKDIIVVPMHEAFLTCLDGPAASVSSDSLPSVPVPPIGVVPPKKTRQVNPVYPKDAQSAGRQGIVIIEATISPEGCVNRGEILQGVSFDLDVSAMRAVTGWQFTPTLLNGKPVPVFMTVTVQFTLR
jgi:TonB family protein